MAKLLVNAPEMIQRRRDERRREYATFIEDQRKLGEFKRYHVQPLRIDTIDFMDPLPQWDGMEELDPLLSWIVKRIYKPEPELNCVMTLTGEQGSGKSYSAMRLGYMTDLNFDANSIAFNLKEFKQAIDKHKKTIVLDDAETFVHSRDSMSRPSKWLSKIFDSIRFKRNFIIITAPSFESVEKTIRLRTQIQAISRGTNIANRTSIISPYFLSIDPMTGELYRHRPIIFDDKKHIYVKMGDLRVAEPPRELISEYRIKKDAMFERLNKQLEKIDKGLEGKRKSGIPKYAVIKKLIDEGKSIEEIARELNTPKNTVYKLIQYGKEKGEYSP